MIAGCGEGSSPPPNDSQAKAASLAALKKLGAYIRRDEQGEVVEVNLMNTQITDAGLVHLKELTELQTLFLGDTQITDAKLVRLKGLNNLQELYLTGTKVTDAGVADLKKALPNCLIIK